MRATETSSPFFFVLPPFSSQLAFLFLLFVHSMLERKKQKCQEYFVPQHARRMWIGSAEEVCVVKGENSLPASQTQNPFVLGLEFKTRRKKTKSHLAPSKYSAPNPPVLWTPAVVQKKTRDLPTTRTVLYARERFLP